MHKLMHGVAATLLLAAAVTASASLAPASAAETKAKAPATGPAPLCDPLHLIPGCQQPDGSVFSAATSDAALKPAEVWKNIISAATPDLQYAKALADSAATPNSKLRSACYAAIIAANQQASGANLKNADGSPMPVPNPDLITKLEQAAELVDNLQPTAPVISGCAPAANAVSVSVLTFVNAIATGVAAKVLSGGVLP